VKRVGKLGDKKMKGMFNETKFQTILVWFCFVVLSAVFITDRSAQANEPTITNVDASKKSVFGKRDFFVSVLHEDTGFEHYADGFEILSVSGEIIAKRVLAHPHVDEQPVTRDLRSVSIPDGVTEIDVRAHDSVHGYGPKVRVQIPAGDVKIKFKAQ
jgi:hypothetical protein